MILTNLHFHEYEKGKNEFHITYVVTIVLAANNFQQARGS